MAKLVHRLRPLLVAGAGLFLVTAVAAQTGSQRPGEPSSPRRGQGQVQGPGQGQRPIRGGLPARDAAEAPTGTARIRGVIVAADSGTPVRRAVVRVSAREMREARTVMTDAQGRYDVRDLPAGRYNVSVSKAGFVSLQYGQRRAFEQGRPLEVADGQLLDGINFTLPRGSVISGRIVDEFGDPVADAMVTASRYQYMRGQRRLMPISRPAQTNDLGQYRLYGLSPGEYIVTGTVRSMGFFEATEETSGYAPTYFPGTSDPGEAQRVRVAIGQEVAADFSLIPARLVRVSGTLLTSSGKPATAGSVRLADRTTGGPMFMGFTGGRVRNDGTFTISGVAPGSYNLVASTQELMDPGEEAEVESGRMPVTVGNEDLTGIVVSTTKGATATGQIVFEEGQTTIAASSMRLFASPADPEEGMGPMGMGGRGGRVKEDWTFELRNLFGRTVLYVMNPPNAGQQPLSVKAILLGGEDVTDRGFEVRGQQRIEGLQVVLTSKSTELSGAVTDGRSRPVTDYVVVLFAEDEALWSLPNARYTRVSRPDQDGRFSVKGLPPGDYLAVALEYLESGTEQDPEVLARLRESATSVRLSEAEKKSLDLRLTVSQ